MCRKLNTTHAEFKLGAVSMSFVLNSFSHVFI